MIVLFDYFHTASQDLHYSLQQAGFHGATVVINDDGFLPQGVTSPYSYFCQMEEGTSRPRYFNQLDVPFLWEITGSNSGGEVWEYNQKRAAIFYAEPKHRRMIKNVDWLDQQGRVRFTDHYNQYGWLYARTDFTTQQKATIRTYFNQEGLEVIVENLVTGDILLTWEGRTECFPNRLSFVDYYLSLMGWDRSHIWYNSLSTPFFFSYGLKQAGEDILFWQEPIQEDLPGNMKVLLNRSSPRTQKIVVQDYATYEKMKKLVPAHQQHQLSYLGYLYPEYRKNHNRLSILIVTNSDQIEHLETLTAVLPDFQFHIAALTEMSKHLMAYAQKQNVQLYPNVSQKMLEQLYRQCDIYLDINYGSEVMNSVRTAFEQNMVLLAFDTTIHHPQLMRKEQVFSAQEPMKMLAFLDAHRHRLDELARLQRLAFSQDLRDYQILLEEIS